MTAAILPTDARVLRRAAIRRAVGRVHLWLALALGAYIIVLSVSGSAIVFRREFNRWLVPRTVASTEGERLTGEVLREAVVAAYPGYTVLEVREPARPERPVFVALEREGRQNDRLFDPYAVLDLGETFPPTLRAVEWLVDLHDNLLAGQTGRLINGIGGGLFLVLVVTGTWLWWPGKAGLARSLTIGRPRANRRFLWQLHSVVGIWTLALALVWGLTAVYFAFPDGFERTIDYFDDDPNDTVRPGEGVLLALIQLHFGRFGGLPIRFLWAALGLVPAAMFVTGFVLWRGRVARRARSA